MSFMSNPTHVLEQYLTSVVGVELGGQFDMGRLAMALELITVLKALEQEYVALAPGTLAELISVVQTLLIDQGVADTALEWYDGLSEWRRPKFVPYGNAPDASQPRISSSERRLPELSAYLASLGGGLQGANVLAEGTRALLDERQSQVLSYDESELPSLAEAESTQIEQSESPDDSAESRAEFLRQTRIRHGTLSKRPLDRSERGSETD